MRILIVEDHADLAREIAEQAKRCGLVPDSVGSLNEAREVMGLQQFAITILDRRLPDGDGVSLIPFLRSAQPGIRILMLTALVSTLDKVNGLDAGADDYLAKPFDPDELTARIRACMRRPGGDPTPAIQLGNLSFDPNNREVFVSGQPIVMQRREISLLDALMRRSGRVARREVLAEEVFGNSDEINWQTLTALVSQLRGRLKEIGADVDVHAARGVGYFIAKAKK